MLETKACSSCKVEKPVADFHKDAKSPSGLQNYCKECKKKADHTSARRAIKKEQQKSLEGRAATRLGSKKAREKLPGSSVLCHMVSAAVRSGKLIKPSFCEVCGSTENLEFHHDDYDYALDGRVLCCQCHHDWHGEYGEAKNHHLLEPDGPYAKGTYKLKKMGQS